LSGLRVVADKRERRSGVPSLLRTLGLKVQFATLDMGDYVIPSGYFIERKTVGDFVNSLFSGRLFKQAERLHGVYEAPLFLVEGDLQNAVDAFPNPRSIWGAFVTLIFTYGARILFTRDRQQTADFIFTLATRGGAEAVRPRIYKKVRPKTIEEAKIGLLSSLPGIGSKLALRLLRHFGSARKVFSASVAELTMVEGIGKMKAYRVAVILDSQELAQNPICQSKLAT